MMRLFFIAAVASLCLSACKKDNDYSRKNILEVTYINSVPVPKDTVTVYTPQKAMFEIDKNANLRWHEGAGLRYQAKVIKPGVKGYKILF